MKDTALAANAISSTAEPMLAAAGYLGGPKSLGATPDTALAVHDLLEAGLPGAALKALRSRLGKDWTDALMAQVLGVTPRTIQRQKDAAVIRLSPEQGSRAWSFAALLAQATEVLGAQQAAEDWMRTPARGLEGRVPLDLLDTSAGRALVQSYLRQMEYGVYV